jgi:glycosyltransferase involved in cell wall biosynthesis
MTEPWELVVADNGSSDGSAKLAESFAAQMTVRVVDASARTGPAFARNVGAAAARGEWIAFCDADDVADSSWLRALFGARGRGDLVAGQLDPRLLNPASALQARGFHQTTNHLPEGPGSFLPYAASANILIRRDHLERLGGWDETLAYCEDVDLCWKAQLAGLTLVHQDDAIMNYRFRGNGRELFRQVRNYASYEPELFLRYAQHGATRPPRGHLPWQVFWLVTRLPYLVMEERRRLLWAAVAGELAGHLRGSLRCRVWYL